MKSVESLQLLQQTSFSLLSAPVPVAQEYPSVKTQLQILTELTFIYVLKLLGVEDEKKLESILSRLRKGTLFYDFTFLAHNLAKSKTDFDFLTQPENLPVYAKIAEVSQECGVVLLPYVNVLARIADNKQYGLYSENQEIQFFLDEYDRCKQSVSAKEFLHQFKKILKYRTQLLFERFIKDGIFSIIQSTLNDYSSKISGEQTLVFYVYGLHYYQSDISNDDENFLLEHIKFCVTHLNSHNAISFESYRPPRYFPNFANETQAIKYFFNHNTEVLSSQNRFIGLLKDVCPTDDAYDFCVFLRKNFYSRWQKNIIAPILYESSKSEFSRLMAETLDEYSDKIPLYQIIQGLLKQGKIICIPEFSGRKAAVFETYAEVAKYLHIKEYEVKEYIKTGRPCLGYKISLKL